jgi:very-short-patch-repair endonuclease
MKGYTFTRQKPLGKYIVDLYCKPLQLVIEVDVGYHFEEAQKLKDKERQSVLEDMGLHFLWFEDEQVRRDMPAVLRKVEAYVEDVEATGPAFPASLPAKKTGVKLDSLAV